ncbi:MAG TPA: SCP2 sterol-binding domain-containing protein [Solirubrobacteraceae bacterium]|nr:SCP2 sterol-binding domain-containing protein [Solirubrobacteraceae bacterium]
MRIGDQDMTTQPGSSSETLLDRLLQTPARRPILDAIFWQMPRRIATQRSTSLNASVQWRVTGRADGDADHYRLDFSDGRCRVRRGADGEQPTLTITLSAVELVRLVTRRSNPVAAFFTGRITIAGNAMVAAKLGSLFLGAGAADRPSNG